MQRRVPLHIMRLKLFILVFAFLTLHISLPDVDLLAATEDQYKMLEEDRQSLHQRVAMLQREQDFLLFQKEMYMSDSKYLILNASEKTGQLKYKNRVLKKFHFKPSGNFSPETVQLGMLSLTKIVEGKGSPRALIFGTSLVMRWKRDATAKKGEGIPTIFIAEHDLLSVYSTMREGAKAYLVP